MSRIPKFLEEGLLRVSRWQAREVWEWLQTNSNTVIVDDLEAVIQTRRDRKEVTDAVTQRKK